MSRQITVATRPSLAFPGRWSVDYWENDRIEAAYQTSLITFDSPDDAANCLVNAQLTLEKQGIVVVREHHDSNASRGATPSPDESEAELAKHLETYIKASLALLQKISFAELFDFTNWPKGIKAIVSKSPQVLSLIFLAALLLRGPFDRLLKLVLPKELELSGDALFASAPLLLLATSLHVYMLRARHSSELNRVREWILHLVVSYGWDRERFVALFSKELATREYASAMDTLKQMRLRNEGSFRRLVQALGQKIEKPNDEEIIGLVEQLFRGDFARKIQALCGMASEPDYRPKNLAISPYFLLISSKSVKAIMLDLARDDSTIIPGNFKTANEFLESSIVLGFMIGLLLTLAIICPTLIWTTILAWQVSPILFVCDVIASLWTIWLLTSRGVAVAFQRKYIPKGLTLNDCAEALNVM